METIAIQRNSLILYLQDSPADLFLFKTAAQQCGARFDVQAVTNLDAAKDYLSGSGRWDRHRLPALVVSDCSVVGETGQDLLRWIRRQTAFSELKVVTFRSAIMTEPMEDGDGRSHVLVKPSTLARMREVARCLDKCARGEPGCGQPLRCLREYQAENEAKLEPSLAGWPTAHVASTLPVGE